GTVESMHFPRKETDMNTQQPAKRLSAAAALPLAIIIEAGAIAVNVGGVVTATLAFLLCFGVCHQIRLARWRRHRTA
ncbi:MAG TPA: hypothetical protein VFW26_07400, partial [Gaiellales bacterium]|nr:hypothetical protein [Gaiellales bacterium]